ncbi:hypothetical protein ACLESD_42385 [Pyxidicoccus sp. 3LFB2]
MASRTLLTPAACLVAGLLMGLGWNSSPLNQQPEPPPAASETSVRGAASCPPPSLPSSRLTTNPQLLEDIRTTIRDELRAELVAFRSPPEEVEAEARNSRDDTEERQRLAHDKANQVLWDAVRVGAWTEEARQQFRGTLHELSIPQQDQLIGELFSAIQSGRMKVDGTGPPL